MTRTVVYGVTETCNKIDSIALTVREKLDNAIDLFSADMTKEIKESAPYDTGRYMSSWYYEREEALKYAIISRNSDVPYNVFLVFGTAKFVPIAYEPRYKYPDSERGIIHDIRQIKFIYSIRLAQTIKQVDLLSANISLAGL